MEKEIITPQLDKEDWDALWNYHYDKELESANKECYMDAEFYKGKKEKIREYQKAKGWYMF